MLLLCTSILLSTLALLLSLWMGRRNPGKSSALTAGMIILLLFLPLTIFVPKVAVDMVWIPQGSQLASLSPTSSTSQPFTLENILFGVWLVGTVILFSRLLKHYLAVRKWRRNSERCTTPQWTHRLHESCSLLDMDSIPSLGICDHITSPVVTGLIYPQILLPRTSETWSEETINHVLLHELGHVKRRDLWVSIASHMTCALHWFNPLIWMLRKQQASQCEFACDSYVLASGADPKNYIHALCDVAETASNDSPAAMALAMANKASLRQRVDLLLQDQKPSGRALTGIMLLSTASIAVAFNVVQPKAPQPNGKAPSTLDAPAPIITPKSDYSAKEIESRLEADPFPGNADN